VSKGGGTTRFLYDGADLVAEYNASGTVLQRYVHGPGFDNPIVWYEGSALSTRRFLMADERGSVVAVSDGAGTALQLNSYDEYGIPVQATWGGSSTPGRPGLARWGSTTTRPGCTRPRSAGSCRPIPSATPTG